MEWVGSFVYAGPVDAIIISDGETHYSLIEALEDQYDISLNTQWAMGWLYADTANLDKMTKLYVQWSSIEYYPGNKEIRDRAAKKLESEYHIPVAETEGHSQWLDGETYAKVAEVPNRARSSWPRGYGWVTSWVYLPDIDQVVLDMDYQHSHDVAIEHWEDAHDQEANLDQPFEVGLILQNNATGKYFIYPEYSDWARIDRGLDHVPVSDNAVLDKVKQQAEEQGYQISGIIRGKEGPLRDDDEDMWADKYAYRISKFRAKKPKRYHVRKHYMRGFHHYDGYALFIPMWYPSIQTPEGGQIDTTGRVSAENEQLELPIIIKFVSLPDKFLVGENTHHIYLLEAEYGEDVFPSDTVAIGRAWLENDTITGIGFDFGNETGQNFAIRQLTAWAHREGYEVSPSLKTQINDFAITHPDML